MCEYIIEAQQGYAKDRVAACQTRDLVTAKHTIFPSYVELCGAREDQSGQQFAAVHGDTPPEVLNPQTIGGSPALCRCSLGYPFTWES